MTWPGVASWVALAVLGAVVTAALAGRAVAKRGPRKVRLNWQGAPVPVVLGGPLVAGSSAGAAVLVALADARHRGAATAVLLVVAVLGAAGEWDDRRGDELARGFAGHFEAARAGRLTGGLVKLAAGSVAGLGAGLLTSSGLAVIETALLVALFANLVNLLDRAPGRALKAAAVAGGPLLLLGASSWALAAAGSAGAAAALARYDLGERGMLGDAGANPLGGVVGLGYALTLPPGGRIAAIVALLALNLASERWSFSAVIDGTPWLALIDRLGRK